MSAPECAITLEEKNENWAKGSSSRAGVTCDCGWKGKVPDLLCDPRPNATTTLWCPQCRTAGWVFD